MCFTGTNSGTRRGTLVQKKESATTTNQVCHREHRDSHILTCALPSVASAHFYLNEFNCIFRKDEN